MHKWKVLFEVWPFSGVDQKVAGDRKQQIMVEADDMRGALRAAELVIRGVKTNPAVWEAPITTITQVCD